MDQDAIRKLADLARMDVQEEELAGLSSSIGDILKYVDSLREVAAESDLTPTTGAVSNVMRDDVVTHETGEYTEALLKNAPDTENGYVRVKKIF